MLLDKSEIEMEYTIKLNEQQVEVLKSILAQIEPMPVIVTPVTKPKKLSKTEQAIQNMKELHARNPKRNR